MSSAGTISPIARAKLLLDAMLSESDTIIGSIGDDFQRLAQEIDSLLCLAAATLESMDQAGVTTIPAKVRDLVSASDQFIHRRFAATSAILTAMNEEEKLLHRFSGLNSGIRSVAQETRMLGLLTGIEAARLGPQGMPFQILSRDLRSFAETVADSSMDLASQTSARRTAIKESQRRLTAALPRMRGEFERIDATFATTFSEVTAAVEELSACHSHFHACLATVASQIAGVVCAIQSHDVTRQQAEHVRDVLDTFSTSEPDRDALLELPEAAVGLTIQIFQLRNIKEAMQAWAAQIDACLGALLGVSRSDLAKIGPLVLRQEQFLESHVLRINDLKEECRTHGEEVECALLSLSKLMQMISRSFKTSRVIRDRMHLLSLNSRIEANTSAAEAAVMVEISKNITRVAADWNRITDKSEKTMGEMSNLVVQAQEGMKTLCPGGNDGLDAAQFEIGDILRKLKGAAQSSARSASQIASALSGLQAAIQNARSKAHSINRLIDAVTEALQQIESVRNEMEVKQPGVEMLCASRAQIEREYSARYTTEIERHLLRAALYGERMPAPQVAASGNDVELF